MSQQRGLSQKDFQHYGKELGLSSAFLKIAYARQRISISIWQAIADQQALARGGCTAPKPPPKLDEIGYWWCDGSNWVWIPAV